MQNLSGRQQCKTRGKTLAKYTYKYKHHAMIAISKRDISIVGKLASDFFCSCCCQSRFQFKRSTVRCCHILLTVKKTFLQQNQKKKLVDSTSLLARYVMSVQCTMKKSISTHRLECLIRALIHVAKMIIVFTRHWSDLNRFLSLFLSVCSSEGGTSNGIIIL